MVRYVLKRLFQMVLVVLAVSIIVFVVMSFTGDPVLLFAPPTASDTEIAEIRASLGLDKSVFVQFGAFAANVLRGDFGRSYIFKQPVLKLIVDRMPATFELVFLSMLISLLIAVPAGVFAGAFPKSRVSGAIMGGSLLGISLPSFWVGILMIFLFAVEWRIFPSSGRGATGALFGVQWAFMTKDGLMHLVMPAITLALATLAMLIRLIRAQMMEVMRQDFIKFARAKGVSRTSLLFSHALKNAILPVVTVFGLQIGSTIAFATVTETIFAWPGMGKLLIDAINTSDRPIIVAYLMIISVIFVVINFTVDIVYTLIDPRIDLK